MNGVVRPTVSQSHIVAATRPRLNRHTAAQGDLCTGGLLAQEAQAAQSQIMLNYNYYIEVGAATCPC